MAIDVKNLQESTRRVIELSVTFLKQCPFVSGTLFLLFFLFIFLRSVFAFLIFALPILIFIVVAFRFIFSIHQQNLKNAKGDSTIHGVVSSRNPTTAENDKSSGKRKSLFSHAQSVRQRNSKKNENRVHFRDDMYENDMLFSTLTYNNSVEDFPKETREAEVDPTNSSITHSQGSNPEYNSNFEEKSNKLSSDNSDEEEEDKNKAVQWTEDDQKNLMDLGFSEMERNKRLESLIAKRKARKLLSLQVRRTLLNIGRTEPSGEIASILIPKARNKSLEPIISPTPGSAPSVLLPVHNPFDLPYDPQEEKPNLTGGLLEELVENHRHNNEAVFCRHESFSLGALSPPWELDQSRSQTPHHRPDFGDRNKAREIPEYSRFKKQLGKEDSTDQTQIESSQEGETVLSTISSREHMQQHQVHDEALVQLNNINHEEGSNDVQTTTDPKLDTDDHMQRHQVHDEALELNDINHEEGSNNVHITTDPDPKLDTDDIHELSSTSSSEVIPPFTTANREEILRSLSFSVQRDREANKRNEHLFERKIRDEPFFYDDKGPFRINHTPSHSIASDLQVEVSEVNSQITNLSTDGESVTFDGGDDLDVELEGISGNGEVWVPSPHLKGVEENESRSGGVREVSEQDIIEVGFSRINNEPEDCIAFESSQNYSCDLVENEHLLSTENSGLPILESVIIEQTIGAGSQLSHQNNARDPVEPPNSAENSAKEEVVYDVNDQVHIVDDEKEIIEFIQHTYGENNVSITREASQDYTNSVDIIEGYSTQPGNDNSYSVLSFEGELEGQSEPEIISERTDITRINSIEGREIVAEKGLSESSSSASPTSLPREKVQISEILNHEQVPNTEGTSIPLETSTQDHDLINSANNIDENSNIVSDKDIIDIRLEPSKITILPDEGQVGEQWEHQTLESNDQGTSSGINPSLIRPIEPVLFLGIDPVPPAVIPEEVVEQVAVASSSSPNSVLQPKFSMDLASTLNFEDINMVSQQSEMEIERNDTVTQLARDDLLEDSTADQIHSGDSVSLQEPSSSSLGNSTEDDNTNYCDPNDAVNKAGPSDGLKGTSDDRADIGIVKSNNENIGMEDHSKLEDTTNHSGST